MKSAERGQGGLLSDLRPSFRMFQEYWCVAKSHVAGVRGWGIPPNTGG